MPRKDGLPTNRELQMDFTASARDVFVATFERSLESKISLNPAYEDKPLSHLFVTFRQKHRTNPSTPTQIYRESLRIAPLQVLTAVGLEQGPYGQGNELFRGADNSVIEFYRKTADAIADTAITDSFQFGQLTSTAIEANWTADRDPYGSKVYHAGTFRERPRKMSLVSAKIFAEGARAYVDSDDFDKPLDVRGADYILGLRETNPLFDIDHFIGLNIDTNLPLNGHESQRFIQTYLEQMTTNATKVEAQVDRLTNLGAPDVILNERKEYLARLKKAEAMAKKLLKD